MNIPKVPPTEPISTFQDHPLNQLEIPANQLALIRTTSSFCGRGEGVDARNGGGCGGGQGGAHGGGLVEEMDG